MNEQKLDRIPLPSRAKPTLEAPKYEYCLQTWGGFYNEEHQKAHGYEEGIFFFDTKEERDNYIKTLRFVEETMNARVLMVTVSEGYNVRTHTVLHRITRFEGKDYYTTRDLGPAYEYEAAKYMLEWKWYAGFNDYPLGDDFDYGRADYAVIQEWITGAFPETYTDPDR